MGIRPARREELKYIKKMCDEYIGPDYYTSGYLECAFDDEAHFFTVYTNEDDIPVAFIYMFTAAFSEAGDHLRLPGGISAPAGTDESMRVGIFKTTCTDAQYRRRGILSALMRFCEGIFRDIGISLIFLDALRLPSGRIPAESSLEMLQFRRLAEIRHPWSDIDSHCPYCGRQHCICDAILFYKEIDRNGKNG